MDKRESNLIAVVGTGVICVLFVCVMIINVWYMTYSCKVKFAQFNPDYGIIQGCMIEYNGKKIPSENFRLVD